MRAINKIVKVLFSVLVLVSLACSSTVTGVVKGPDGSPFMGAFVQAQDRTTKITTNVLSAKDGRYRLELSAGTYDLRIKIRGYRAEPRPQVSLKASQDESIDWTLQTAPIRWSDLSLYEGKQLLPEGKGKDILDRRCFQCHSFETRMAGVQRDEDGWKQAIHYMRTAMHYRLAGLSDENADTLVSYLNSVWGVDSKVPRAVGDLPAFKALVRPTGPDALNIIYVTYELPGPNRMPFSAAPAKDGKVWIPYFGDANKIARLDPRTAEVEEFPVPFQGTAGIHSAVGANDGTAWLAEQGSNRVGKWDPKTRQITEYQDAYLPGKEGLQQGGRKHTTRVDPAGMVWTTGGPLTRLNPETGKFARFEEVPSAYGIVIDQKGDPWFAEYTATGKIGKVDHETGKVTKYDPPTPKSYPRRIDVDSDGAIWFAEWNAGKIARFDPNTQAFKEYPLPGPSPTPYAFIIDRKHRLWYSSEEEDIVGCLDPATGKVVEYPFPYSENTMREFFLDGQGRVWFGSPSNNKVGYFYLAGE